MFLAQRGALSIWVNGPVVLDCTQTLIRRRKVFLSWGVPENMPKDGLHQVVFLDGERTNCATVIAVNYSGRVGGPLSPRLCLTDALNQRQSAIHAACTYRGPDPEIRRRIETMWAGLCLELKEIDFLESPERLF